MNIHHEQVIETLVCHCAPQEGLDAIKGRELPATIGTSDRNGEMQLKELIDLPEVALENLALFEFISDGPYVCYLFDMICRASKPSFDGIWQ